MVEKKVRWVYASDVVPMFPTLVWKIQLEEQLRNTISARALPALSLLRSQDPPLRPGQGWQSVQTLHTFEEFQDLVSPVRDAVASILQFLRIGYDPFEITACWATILAPGAEHRVHDHPNNFLSGVYYLRTHAGADTINFHDPRSQAGIIRPPVTELTAENTEQVVLRVTDGTLLLFPAYLRHSVDVNASSANRISISFNIMFSAFTENLTKPLWSPSSATASKRPTAPGSRHFLQNAAKCLAMLP
jgi:uncharacterized protein (TIGR02466 family)